MIELHTHWVAFSYLVCTYKTVTLNEHVLQTLLLLVERIQVAQPNGKKKFK